MHRLAASRNVPHATQKGFFVYDIKKTKTKKQKQNRYFPEVV